MYGLTPPQMFLVWFAVTMLLGGGVLLLACIIEAFGRQVVKWKVRRQYAAAPVEQPWVWTRVDLVRWDIEESELIETLADDGDALLESDANIGKVYLPPKERRAA